MIEDPAVALVAVAIGWFVFLRRALAFRLRSDYGGMWAALLLMPVLVLQIRWPALPHEWLVAGVAPSFLLAQYAMFQATMVETDRLRALRRELPRWRLLTGTPPRGYRPEGPAPREWRPNPRTLLLGSAGAVLVIAYAVVAFGWGSLLFLTVFFWAFMALYRFSFSPDN